MAAGGEAEGSCLLWIIHSFVVRRMLIYNTVRQQPRRSHQRTWFFDGTDGENWVLWGRWSLRRGSAVAWRPDLWVGYHTLPRSPNFSKGHEISAPQILKIRFLMFGCKLNMVYITEQHLIKKSHSSRWQRWAQCGRPGEEHHLAASQFQDSLWGGLTAWQ